MSEAEQLILAGQSLGGVALLAGLMLRGHWRSCYTFVAYLLWTVTFGGLLLVWPERFFTRPFWLMAEGTQGLLKLGLAAELGTRIFVRLPGARAAFARVLLAVLVLMALAVAPILGEDLIIVANVGLPRLHYGSALIFAGLLGTCLWYHVPLYPIHKAILVGLVPYLLLFTVAIQSLATFGWELRGHASLANSLAYLVLLAYWIRAVWRRYAAGDVSPAVLSFLQPWTKRA